MAIQEDGNRSTSYKEGTTAKQRLYPICYECSICEEYEYEN